MINAFEDIDEFDDYKIMKNLVESVIYESEINNFLRTITRINFEEYTQTCNHSFNLILNEAIKASIKGRNHLLIDLPVRLQMRNNKMCEVHYNFDSFDIELINIMIRLSLQSSIFKVTSIEQNGNNVYSFNLYFKFVNFSGESIDNSQNFNEIVSEFNEKMAITYAYNKIIGYMEKNKGKITEWKRG